MKLVTKRCLRLAAGVAFLSAFALAFAPGTAGAATSPPRAAWWNMTVAGGAPPPTTVPSPPPTTLPVPETTLPPTPSLPSTTLPSAPPTTLPSTTVPATTVPSATTIPASQSAATIEVGNNDSQYTAIAAVQYSVPLDQSGLQVDPKSIDALLVLSVVPGATAGTPDLVACPATSNWASGPDQKAKTAPHYDCQGGHAAKGHYNLDTLTVTWNLSWLQERSGQPGVFSVVILPAGAPRNAGVFNATLKPNANSLQVMSWEPVGGPSAGMPPPVAAPPPAPVASSGSPAAAGPGSGSGGSSPGAFTTPTTAGAAPSPSAPSSATTTPPAALGPTKPTALRTAGLGAARGLAIGLLVALGMLLSSASGRTAREPRLLVPLPAKAAAASGDAPPAG